MEALGKIGGFITGKTGQGLLTGAGSVANLLARYKQQQYLNNQIKYQKMVQGIVSDPAKLAARARSFESPLNQGLTQSVGNEVQAYNAERGLATAPNIQAAVLAQALAPYIQHNQNTALQAAISSLEVPAAGRSVPNFGDTSLDLSEMIKQLLRPEPRVLDTGGPSVIPKPEEGPDVPPPDVQFPQGPLPDLFPQITGGGGEDIDLGNILQYGF